MTAFYDRPPTEEELVGTGFTVDDYADDEPFEVWPENMAAINLFTRLQTQLRTGAMGAIGFDYNAYFAVMDRMKLSDQDHEWMFDDIRVIESAALTAMNKKD